MQVLTTQQWAIIIVHAYPFFSGVEAFFEGLLPCYPHEPSMQSIMADAHAEPLHTEWAALEDYLYVITDDPSHDYQPIPRSRPHTAQPCHSQAVRSVRLHDMLL